MMEYTKDQLKAAYALNLCTVSVSQIIDYDDINIMEQEYEAILNNINIEEMPKDEALLHVLKQILDTITFFRIQEGDKQFIERDYQEKIKNAIWSAVPSLNVIVAVKEPITTAVSLVSQIGTGYMNYRRAKAEAKYELDKARWQLERTAIDQFNGLRRELFDTAWRLSDAYGFSDALRLSERQIKQYNAILMDDDAERRYERLNEIKESFIAYPPFWYFFGNTANILSQMYNGNDSDYYRSLAINHYKAFLQSFRDGNLLRENQIASACALEYIDLSSLKTPEEIEEAKELLEFAVKMSGGANDIMQMCAFAYMKVGEFEEASKVLRRLVNERYNEVINSQLLSAYYVGEFIKGDNNSGRMYLYLKDRIDERYLFPFPQQNVTDGRNTSNNEVQKKFIENQKEILTEKYGLVLNLFQEKYRVLFNKCIPVPGNKEYTNKYFDDSPDSFGARKADGSALLNKKGIAKYVNILQDRDYPYNYLPVLNDMMNDISSLSSVLSCEHELLSSLSKGIVDKRGQLKALRGKVEDGSKFTVDTYNEMLDISFDELTKEFFDVLIRYAGEYIENKTDIVSINEAETSLRDFCIEQGFSTPEEIYQTANDIIDEPVIDKSYLGIELIEDGVNPEVVNNRFIEIKTILARNKASICPNDNESIIHISGQEGYERYFIRAGIPNKNEIRKKTVAVLDDLTEKDRDLLFTTDGIVQIVKAKMKETVKYEDIMINADSTAIVLHHPYINNAININVLIKVLGEICNKPLEIDKRKSPLDLINRVLKN